MNNYNYNYDGASLVTPSTGILIWTVVSIILAIIGGFIVYFLFIKPDKNYNNKFVNWLRDFLNFDHLLIENIIKISYLILAIYITLYSFGLIATSFFLFLGMLTLGNVILRVLYEFSILMIKICKDISEINNKIKKENK